MKSLAFLILASCAGWGPSDGAAVRYSFHNTSEHLNRTSQILMNGANNYRHATCTTQAMPFSYSATYQTTCQ